MNTTASVFGNGSGGVAVAAPVTVVPLPPVPAPKPVTPSWHGPRWEHKVLSLGASRGGMPEGVQKKLADTGEEGWELVAVNVIGFDWHYHFKRRVIEEGQESIPDNRYSQATINMMKDLMGYINEYRARRMRPGRTKLPEVANE